jgi:phospholipase/carboxylesterase
VSTDDYLRHRLVDQANAQVRKLLDSLRADHDHIRVAGFSQGAMLALDVALAPDSGVDRVAALSGVLLADTVAYLGGSGRPEILLVHGRQDDEIPYSAGEAARDLLTGAGLAVEWVAFDGGHRVPAAVAERLRRFLVG